MSEGILGYETKNTAFVREPATLETLSCSGFRDAEVADQVGKRMAKMISSKSFANVGDLYRL